MAFVRAALSIEGVTDPLPPPVTINSPITLRLAFTNASGAAVTPSGVMLEVSRPDGVELEIPASAMTADGTGVWLYTLLLDQASQWRFRGTCSGAATADLPVTAVGSALSPALPTGPVLTDETGQVLALPDGGLLTLSRIDRSTAATELAGLRLAGWQDEATRHITGEALIAAAAAAGDGSGGTSGAAAGAEAGAISGAEAGATAAEPFAVAAAGSATSAETAKTAADLARSQAQAANANARLRYATLALLNANLVPGANAVAEVDSDGINNGTYLKAGATGAGSWSRINTATVSSLDGRNTTLEGVVLPQVASASFLDRSDMAAGEVEIDADERIMREVSAAGYRYRAPIQTDTHTATTSTIGTLTTARTILGGQDVLYIDPTEYALALVGKSELLLDEDNRIIWDASVIPSSTPVLTSNAVAPLDAVPLRQAKTLSNEARLPRGTLRFALLGDSRTDNSFAGGNRLLTNARAYPFWLEMASRGAARVVSAYNFGVAGENTDQILARLPAALATAADADAFIVMCQVNDATATVPSVSNLTAMADLITAAGKMAVFVAELPAGPIAEWDSARVARHMGIRSRIMRFAERPGIRCVDVWSQLIDTSSTVGGWLPQMTYDNLHLTCTAARILGNAVWDAVTDLCRTPAPLVVTNADVYDATNNPLGSLVTNGLMQGTAGTKSGTGSSTGTVADGWNVAATASYSAASSKVSVGGRDWQQVAFSGTAVNAGQSVLLSQSLDVSKLSAGDVVELLGEIQVDAGSVGLYGPMLELNVNGSVTELSVGYQSPASATSANPTVAWGGVFRSQPYPIPAGLTTLAVQVAVRGLSGAAMSATFRATSISLRKLSA